MLQPVAEWHLANRTPHVPFADRCPGFRSGITINDQVSDTINAIGSFLFKWFKAWTPDLYFTFGRVSVWDAPVISGACLP